MQRRAKGRRKAAEAAAAPAAALAGCSHLIESICSFLGLADVLQCRLVCKGWHQTLSPILRIRRNFCCRTHEKIKDFLWLRPERCDMHVCPPLTMKRAPQHPDATCWMSTIRMERASLSNVWKLVSAAHGLLCFHLWDLYHHGGRSSLLVFNPATGQHRELPKLMYVVNVESVGMRSDPVDKSYMIIVVGKGTTDTEYFHDDGNPIKNPYYVAHVEIYCSKTGLWEHHSHFITDTGMQKGEIAWWQGQFHWIVHKPDCTLRLLAYDMDKRKWIEAAVPCLSTFGVGRANALLNWKGSLLARFPYASNTRYWQVSRRGHKKEWEHAEFSTEKPMSLHVVAHFLKCDKLQICIYDPYSFGPAENAVLSSQSYIVHEKRESKGPCFSFSPCMSMQV